MTSTPNTATTTTAPSTTPAIWADYPNNYPRTDPADCQPWCHARAGRGHLAGPGESDPECSTDLTEVRLGKEVDYGRGEMRPDFVHAYLWYAKPEGVTVNLSHHEDVGPAMTPAEARQLAEVLIRLADLAEAAGR